MKISGIYKISSQCKPNRIYIGSSKDIYNRWWYHKNDLKKGKHASSKIARHVNKYGLDDLKFEIIVGCDEDKLLDMEQFYLEAYRPYFNSALFACANMRGRKASDETKAKQREAWKRRLPDSKETRMKKSLASKRPRNTKGRKLSDEHKKKISMGGKGKIISQEQRDKISKSLMGHPKTYNGKVHDEATKLKISNSLKGKKQSIETRMKRSESCKKASNSGWFKKGETKLTRLNKAS